MSIMLTQLQTYLREKNITIRPDTINLVEEAMSDLQDMTEQPLCLEYVVIRPEGLWVHYLPCGQKGQQTYKIQMDADCLMGENYEQ